MKSLFRLFLLVLFALWSICCSENETDIIEVTSVAISTKAVEMTVGETLQLSASVEPKNATDKEVSWSSSDETVVSISKSGMATALKEGNAIITALVGKCVSVCQITVKKKEIAVSSIELNKTEIGLTIGETITLTATVKPDDATDKTVVWSSTNEEIATVDEAGTVSAIKDGDATIIAKAGDKTAECKVAVVSKKVDVSSIEINRATTTLKVGEEITLVATVKPDDATDKSVEWSSSNKEVCSVDNSGKVTAIKEGSATITAKAGEKVASCNVSVVSNLIEVTSISLDKTSATIYVRDTLTLVATVKPDDATDKTVEWTSSSDEIATVDKGGRVVAISKGSATITAKAGKKSATCRVTVKTVDVTSIQLDQSSATLIVGDSLQLVATVKPDNATDKTVSWSSSNASVASVNDEGKVIAISKGYTTITAKAGKKTTSCSITVQAIDVTSIVLDKTSISIKEGETALLVATVKPDNATDKTIIWTSSNEEVATVDSNGKVSAIREGSTTITAKAGNVRATCSVLVVSENFKPNGEYLSFTALEDSKVSYKGPALEYSVDKTSWSPWAAEISISKGQTVFVRVINSVVHSGYAYGLTISFQMTGRISAAGNIMSVINGGDFSDMAEITYYSHKVRFTDCTALVTAPVLPATILYKECYSQMFAGCVNLIEAPELPASVLAENCYSDMFSGCTSLTNAPKLPATILAKHCYERMFSGCRNLTNAPELPATILADDCYQEMFSGCSSLAQAPELPATVLARECYFEMFRGCTSLTKSPYLPSTILERTCYYGMFYGCTSLTTAPDLPAITLADSCYSSMFSGCTSLTSAPDLPATSLADSCYSSMFSGCTSLTSAPDLPATSLAYSCYSGMFSGCTSLTSAPDLPATSLAYFCYSGMFSGCTSLTTAPHLPATSLSNYCYDNLFYGCTSLVQAPALPATNLANDCYRSMFYGCSSLTQAPALPAANLAKECYHSMFYGCSSLTEPPMLPAQTLTESCYERMFYGCTSLTYSYDLTATTLANRCYSSMFYGCSSLTHAPALPATALTKECYSEMFMWCSNLTHAPSLPAMILASSCYSSMFEGCSRLTIAPELPATAMAENSYHNMFKDCISLSDAPELPAVSLAIRCYSGMFKGCKSLTIAPELPATTLSNYCYEDMFRSSGLIESPDLVALSLPAYCYSGMFGDCRSLLKITVRAITAAPESYYDSVGSRVSTSFWNWPVVSTYTHGTLIINSKANWNAEHACPPGWTIKRVDFD